MDEVGDRIRDFIRDAFFVEGLADDTSFLQTGVIDSTGVLQLVYFLEEDLGIRVDEQDLLPENLDSIGRLVGFVARKRGA